MQKSRLRIAYQFLFQVGTWSYIYLIWCDFVSEDNPKIIPFISGLFISGMFLYYFSIKQAQKGRNLYLLTIAPVTVILLQILGIPWLITVLFIGLTYKKMIDLFDNEFFTNSSISVTSALSLCIVTVYVFSISSISDEALPFYILIFQFFVFFVGHFLSLWIEAGGLKQERKFSPIFQFGTILLSTSLIAYVLTMALPFLKGGLNRLIGWLLIPVFWVFEPVINFLFEVFKQGTANLQQPRSSSEGEIEQQQGAVEVEINEAINLMPFLYVISIIIVGLIIFMILRKKANDEKEIKTDVNYKIEKGFRKGQRGEFRRRKKERPPSNIPIRKAMYDFERKARKFNKERYMGETIQDWFTRTGIRADSLIPIYEQVRYGQKEVTTDQYESFIETIAAMEKTWKEEKIRNNEK